MLTLVTALRIVIEILYHFSPSCQLLNDFPRHTLDGAAYNYPHQL